MILEEASGMCLFWCVFPLRKAQAMCFLSSPKRTETRRDMLGTIEFIVFNADILIFFLRFDVARHVFR